MDTTTTQYVNASEGFDLERLGALILAAAREAALAHESESPELILAGGDF